MNALSGNAIDLAFAWDPTEPVATRPITMQRQGGWNFFYTHDGNKNVSDVVSFQQARGIAAHYEYAPFGSVTAATRNTNITAFDVRSLDTMNDFFDLLDLARRPEVTVRSINVTMETMLSQIDSEDERDFGNLNEVFCR